MARLNFMRWSGRSQCLLIQAVLDPAFIESMQSNSIPESQFRLWIAKEDVPTTYRGRVRGRFEDWATANPSRTVGIGF